MDSTVLVALIGFPSTFVVALATYRKTTTVDKAVNHRVTGQTISEDIADIKVELRQQRQDIVWLIREHAAHIKEHNRIRGHLDDDDE